MDDNITDDSNPLPLPESFVDKVALDSLKRIVYVARDAAGDPVLLTWVDRNRSRGIIFMVKPVELDEVARLRNTGLRQAEETDADMKVRGEAIELLKTAARYRASDIHFMMRGSHTEIQVAVKGGLRVLAQKTQQEGEALVRAIYQGVAQVRDASYNVLEFQNAQIPGDALPPETGLTSVRIVRGPCYPQAQGGAFMTLRLQYSTAHTEHIQLKGLELPRKPEGSLRLGSMGYTRNSIEKLKLLMDAPSGIVIFTGPTGSGKTTSLFEVLQEQARLKPQNRQVTIEDPVEYPYNWAVQMAVTNAKNDTETGEQYSDRVRVALRMAPKIILLGELRGPDVAVSAIEAAVTGHQVFTTLHVTDPFLFVERLEIMDSTRLARKVFCDHKIVRGVIAQRLLPQLCRRCSTPLHKAPNVLPDRLVKALETWGDLKLVRVKGPGCQHCNHDGTTARIAVAEVVVMDGKVMKDFVAHGSEVARDNYRARPDADPSMLEAAIHYALSGAVDPRSVELDVDLIEAKPMSLAGGKNVDQ
ncbi:ATPase, T2SS/T4P/T4SS family [Cupriavidus metallidurans]|uniref:ATPase, T2SS/T4P/T4SS family n=1 Tax=Cupriavidus metallidurans TaxID=119219 RepID=UPI000CE00FFC|nr:ATPase, T2SS/T4P/T4SS family [Cupriavidus metallidurans]AVA38347.1 type II secretion system protein E [Cupriavidus metallidurans]